MKKLLFLLTASFFVPTKSFGQASCELEIDSIVVLGFGQAGPEGSMRIYATGTVTGYEPYVEYMPLVEIATASTSDPENVQRWLDDPEEISPGVMLLERNIAIDFWYPGESSLLIGLSITWQDVSDPFNIFTVHEILSEMNEYELPLLVTGVSANQIDQFSVYPNPSSGTFTIQTTGSDMPTNYEMFDQLGRVVASGTFSANTEIVKLGEVRQGMYMLKLSYASGEVGVRRIVVGG